VAVAAAGAALARAPLRAPLRAPRGAPRDSGHGGPWCRRPCGASGLGPGRAAALDLAQLVGRLRVLRIERKRPQHRVRGLVGVAGALRGVARRQVFLDAPRDLRARGGKLLTRRGIPGCEERHQLPLDRRGGEIARLPVFPGELLVLATACRTRSSCAEGRAAKSGAASLRAGSDFGAAGERGQADGENRRSPRSPELIAPTCARRSRASP